jgi:hypothetical protein
MDITALRDRRRCPGVGQQRRHRCSQGQSTRWSCQSTTTRRKSERELASVSPHHSLHATDADAVALGQRMMRGASMSVAQQIADDLLAKTINKPPTTRCLRRGCCVAVVAVDLCGELANRLGQVLYLGVRETSPQLHQHFIVCKIARCYLVDSTF